MTSVQAGYAASVERCDVCHGIACSDGALADLQRQWYLWPRHDSAALDSGAARDGRRWNELAEVACPSCSRAMQVVRPEGQVHIRLDRCASCQLTFFDAGEMTDLRYETLADTFRGLIARWRGG
jgi:hypothetical protein